MELKWVKITTDMFCNRKIQHLRRLPEGNNIVLIWVMLLTMAGRCNANGMIFLTENIPYTPKMLADELNFEESTVILALDALEKLGMIHTDSGYFVVSGWEEYQNVEGIERIREQTRKRVQKHREAKRISECNVTETQSNATDKEEDIEEDIEREISKKKKSKKEKSEELLESILPNYEFSPQVEAIVRKWVTYKAERNDEYKHTGMETLLGRIKRKCTEYGDNAVCEVIEDSISNRWAGIIFDRLDAKKRQIQGQQRNDPYAKRPKYQKLE